MKNPIEPSLKTERFAVLALVLSVVAAFYFRLNCPDNLVLLNPDGDPQLIISWSFLIYLWPVILAFIYAMFITFPYFRINTQESSALKDQWHKAKDLSLSFFFILQVVDGLLLVGQDGVLVWALPVLIVLFLASLIPTVIRVIKYRQKTPIKL